MIAVTFALPEESADFLRRLRDGREVGVGQRRAVRGWLGEREVLVLHTGIGARAGEIGEILKRERPAVVIASGFAGAVSEDLRIGQVLVASNFSAAGLIDLAREAGATEAVFHQVDRVVEAVEEKRKLAERADAIDMESATLAALAETRGIIFAAIRGVSDGAKADFPVPAEVMFDALRERPRVAALLLFLVTHPGKIAGFVRFVRGVNLARREITECLVRLIGELGDWDHDRPGVSY